MKTFMARKEDVQRKWFLIDAQDKILGKIAVKAANILRGKNKPEFTPHVDNGDFVIIINAEKVALSGKKEEQKKYMHYTGYPSGHYDLDIPTLRERNPQWIIQHAVEGMVPRNRLGRKLVKKLKVYRGAEHPHKAQNPQVIEI